LGVAEVVDLGQRVVVLDGRRWRVVGAAPDHELLFAELLAGLGLVLALEGAVVALVETPGAVDGDPEEVRHVQGDVGGADGPLQQGGVHHVGGDVGVEQQVAALGRLTLALRGQVDVHPPGEQPFRVPDAFAMPEQYQGRHDIEAYRPGQPRSPSAWSRLAGSAKAASARGSARLSPRLPRESRPRWMGVLKPRSSALLKFSSE